MNRTHGKSHTPTWQSWTCMRDRVGQPSNPSYKYYGGRGIGVCDRWRDSFENFLADLGPRPPGTTLERRRVNEDYSPDNCYWATPKQQANNRGNNRLLTVAGKTKSLQEWADIFEIGPRTVANRLKNGWPAEYALAIPPRQYNRWHPLAV